MTERERNYEDECGDHGGRNKAGEPCGLAAGWGTPNDSGRCKRCLGTSPDGSSHEGNDNAVGNEGGAAPEENTNAVTHGAYADQSNLYSEVFDDAERELADAIFADYRDRYERLHGELPEGHRLRLFKIAVNAVTELRVENWVTEKPTELDSGTTWIDRETEQKFVEGVGPVTEKKYRKSPALAAKKTLSSENRMWLKDLDLLGPDEISVDVSGTVDHEHEHEHGLDEGTQKIIEDLAEDLKA